MRKDILITSRAAGKHVDRIEHAKWMAVVRLFIFRIGQVATLQWRCTALCVFRSGPSIGSASNGKMSLDRSINHGTSVLGVG